MPSPIRFVCTPCLCSLVADTSKMSSAVEPPSATKAPLLTTSHDGGAAVVLSDVDTGALTGEKGAGEPGEPQEGAYVSWYSTLECGHITMCTSLPPPEYFD